MADGAADSEQTQHLLERAQAGEPDARDQLLDRHTEFLRRVVELRMDPRLRGRFDPSDVVQEALLEAACRLPDYLQRRPMPFRLWLRDTAVQRLGKLQRRHLGTQRRAVGREVPLPDRSSLVLAQCLQSAGLSPSGQLKRAEVVQRVQESLAQLQKSDREVLLLRAVEGLSNSEIAFQLGVSAEAVSKRHGRALLRLGTLLRAAGFGGREQ
jgi:RNA polymerase sigma-70 factor (ECF subfamily)